MQSQLMSKELYKEIERSESIYMFDRMLALKEIESNSDSIQILKLGNSFVFYSESMPWPQFNTVKSFSMQDIEHLDDMIQFFKGHKRKAQFEITPGNATKELFDELSSRGFYQSGFHCSLYSYPQNEDIAFHSRLKDNVHIRELKEDEFDVYATIHCRGTGLPDNGIPHVSKNNKVLYKRPGWHFFIAEIEQEPCAVGVMNIHGDTTSLTFASTLPEYREKGLHTALILERIAKARQSGCQLVVAQTSYASQSYRNMEKAGMQLGYTRANWTERE